MTLSAKSVEAFPVSATPVTAETIIIVDGFTFQGLFADGSGGALFDFSDFSTLWTDSAGTDQVDAYGDLLGLALDVKNGVVTSSTNFDVSDFTDGSSGSSTVTESGGVITGTVVGGDPVRYWNDGFTSVAGNWYKFTVTNDTANGVGVFFGSAQSSSDLLSSSLSGNSTSTFFFKAVSAASFVSITDAASFQVSAATLVAVAGNHATQTVSANRCPVAQQPRSGITQLLDSSEDLDDPAWQKLSSAAVTENAATAPDGTNTAWLLDLSANAAARIINNATATVASADYIGSFWIRSVSGSGTWPVAAFDGATAVDAELINIDETWKEIEIDIASNASPTTNASFYPGNRIAIIGETLTQAYIWHPQLNKGTVKQPYQNRIDQYNITEQDQPSISGPVGNGTNWWIGGSIPSADYQSGFTIACGFQHATGSAAGNEYILSVGNSASNDHWFSFVVGTVNFIATIKNAAFSPAKVLTCGAIDNQPHIFVAYIQSGNLVVRLDGVEYSTTFTAGASTFDQYSLLALNRVSTSNFANARTGKDPLIIDRVLTASEIANVESNLANQWGVTLGGGGSPTLGPELVDTPGLNPITPWTVGSSIIVVFGQVFALFKTGMIIEQGLTLSDGVDYQIQVDVIDLSMGSIDIQWGSGSSLLNITTTGLHTITVEHGASDEDKISLYGNSCSGTINSISVKEYS